MPKDVRNGWDWDGVMWPFGCLVWKLIWRVCIAHFAQTPLGRYCCTPKEERSLSLESSRFVAGTRFWVGCD